MDTIIVGKKIKISRSATEVITGRYRSSPSFLVKSKGPREILSGLCMVTYISKNNLVVVLAGECPKIIGDGAEDWVIDEVINE